MKAPVGSAVLPTHFESPQGGPASGSMRAEPDLPTAVEDVPCGRCRQKTDAFKDSPSVSRTRKEGKDSF